MSGEAETVGDFRAVKELEVALTLVGDLRRCDPGVRISGFLREGVK